MNILFTEEAWIDYLYWQVNDKNTLKKINALIKDISRTPFEGIGKPEPLRYALQGYWSRRISQEHRLVYKLTDSGILILSVRYHYE